MSAIKFHKASEYKKVFNENGLARQSVLTGEYKDVAIYKCTLAAGAKWEPELYPQQEKVQILLFTEGTGYVATPHKAFQIEEVSVFVPRFDQESFFIQADSELSFLQIVANLSDYPFDFSRTRTRFCSEIRAISLSISLILRLERSSRSRSS